MRNLHKVFFLSLFGLALAAGCTVTTSDSNAGSGGEDTTGTGGKTSVGGNTSAGGTTATGGSTATTFTTGDCTAAAVTAAAAVPDVTTACIDCVYSTACTQAVTCHNDGSCMASTLKALECIALNYQINGGLAIAEFVDACQGGTLTAADIPTAADVSASGMTVKSTDPNAWLGASVPANGTAVLMECPVVCQASDT